MTLTSYISDHDQTNKVTPYVFGHNQSILHQVDPGCDRADVVEWVRRLQELVLGVVHDGGGEGVETHKVRDRTVPLRKKNNIAIKFTDCCLTTQAQRIPWKYTLKFLILHVELILSYI